jgi:hypothetical protein
MADKATSSYGLDLYHAADAVSAPADGAITASIGEIIDAKLSGIDVKEINATHLNQTDRAMRSKPGMFDPGQLDTKLMFNGADLVTLRGYAKAGTFRWWKFSIPAQDAVGFFNTYKFRGWIKTIGEADAPADGDVITMNVSIKIVGDVTVTPYP